MMNIHMQNEKTEHRLSWTHWLKVKLEDENDSLGRQCRKYTNIAMPFL